MRDLTHSSPPAPTPAHMLLKTHFNFSLNLERGKVTYTLCRLTPGKVDQVNIDLKFSEGEEVTFFCEGAYSMHLVGYYTTNEIDIPFFEVKHLIRTAHLYCLNISLFTISAFNIYIYIGQG